MRRSYLGLGILAVLLVTGILTGAMMDAIHRPVAGTLRQAADCAQAGLWEEAGSRAAEAEQEWEKWASFRSCMADHAPVEEAEGLFAQLSIYCDEEDAHFIAVCRELARKVDAVGQAHGLTLWNVL